MTICHWISYFKSSLFFILTIDKDQTKLYSAWPMGRFQFGNKESVLYLELAVDP